MNAGLANAGLVNAGRCRGCGEASLVTVLDLGAVPAADVFPLQTDAGPDARHPLAMAMCEKCSLAQLADDDTEADEPRGIEPQALIDQAADAVDVAGRAGWLRGTTVREFGSPHGGTWIPLLEARGFTEVDAGTPADVVLDCFGIMHAPDQAAAFAARAASVADDGVLLVQFHTLSAIVGEGQWNALRHGHFAYYSLTSLTHLLREAGLVARSAWTFDLYGGTIMVAATTGGEPDNSVEEILRRERELGTDDVATVAALQVSADADMAHLRDSLVALRGDGKSVYAYGAASRAVALFAMARLSSSLLHAVADASPSKQGRRMPGTDIPIVAPAELSAAEPDIVLLTLPDLLGELTVAMPELRGRWWVHGTDVREGLQ